MLEKCYWIAVACNGHTVHANHLRLSHQTHNTHTNHPRALWDKYACAWSAQFRRVSHRCTLIRSSTVCSRTHSFSWLWCHNLCFFFILIFYFIFFFVSSLLPVDLIRFRFVSFSIYYVYYSHLLVILSFHIENRFKPSLSHYTDDHVMLCLLNTIFFLLPFLFH